MKRSARDDSGAVAVMFALLSLVLLGVAALAIDVGQVYAKRSALQSNVDFAVMAAAAELDSDGACNQEVVDKAVEYLEKDTNQVPDQVALNLGGTPGDGDGFIRCDDWKVELWAPTSKVEYGLARAVMDDSTADDGIDVPAYAAAQIKSPSQSDTLPMYAVSGCDSGAQVLTDPPPGPAPVSTAPVATPVGDANLQHALTATPNDVDSGVTTPYPITVGGSVTDVKGWTAQAVFYNAGGPTTYDAPGTTVVPNTNGNGPKDFVIPVTTVPSQVLAANGVWWIRVRFTSPTGVIKWSKYQDSASFTVGELLFCDGMVSGNFGTLRLARSDVPNGQWVSMNIRKGVMPRLVINASTAIPCSPVDSDHLVVSPTDCISTDPGFPNSAATDGFVGTTSSPGRLRVPTTPGCDRNGGDDETPSPALNDDLLTCYILGGHSVGDVVAGTDNILSADIFDSPRFFYIPIIPVQAANGASGAYPIIGFRPGFITKETMAATFDAKGSISGHNGITFQAGHVEQIDVVLFPESALPDTAPPRGGEADYVGSGTKVLTLVE